MERPGAGDYISLTQSEFRPRQNYYNAQDDRTAGIVPYYLSEGQSVRESVSKVYRYSSVSEQAQIADDVCYPGGRGTEDNVPGVWYQDGVAAMQGSQMAYDGHYAPMAGAVFCSPGAGKWPERPWLCQRPLPQPALHRKTPTGKTGFRNP